MPTSQLSKGLQDFRKSLLLRGGCEWTDGQLLERYVSQREDLAFEALVKRHGPMVWGVCRRVLGNVQDGEDAFQATFLVLVRKATSIVPCSMVANWLYGTAYLTAVKARASAARRRARERQVDKMPELVAVEARISGELLRLLDREMSRLPDKYRAAVVLCDLEGKTRKEAARQLGWPEGTVAGRLARARNMLAKRLARHGHVLTATAVAALLAQETSAAAVPVAVKTISPRVAALLEGVLKTMMLTKLKAVMTVCVALAFLLFLGANLVYPTQTANEPAPGGGPDKLRDPLLARTDPMNARQEKSQVQELKAAIDKVLKACGGEDKLAGLKAFTEKVKVTGADGKVFSAATFVQLPGLYRLDSQDEGDAVRHINVFSGQIMEHWKKDGEEKAQKLYLTGAEPLPEYWFDYLEFIGPRVVLRLKDAKHKVSLLAETKVGDHSVIGISVTLDSPLVKQDRKLYFDKETGLLLKEENTLSKSELFYSDYKTIQGFPIAQKLTRKVDGQVVSETQVIEFRVVDKLEAKVFQP